jgi:hypothetical protein
MPGQLQAFQEACPPYPPNLWTLPSCMTPNFVAVPVGGRVFDRYVWMLAAGGARCPSRHA